VLKGNEGAGRGRYPTEKLFEHIQSKFPHLLIIVSGGISNADQVKYYIDRGAVAVGVGTLISACQESKISIETKHRMIKSSADNLTRFSDQAGQQALVFKKYNNDDANHTHSLSAGINNPINGHVFAGIAIDSITDILPVDTIIKSLVAKL
jgi:NAD(P)H-dependent flavin oxidoreductase YrpB (nitropropane dioxygenase family)